MADTVQRITPYKLSVVDWRGSLRGLLQFKRGKVIILASEPEKKRIKDELLHHYPHRFDDVNFRIRSPT